VLCPPPDYRLTAEQAQAAISNGEAEIPGPAGADRFSEYRIGLDHVAFGASRADLDRLAGVLSVAGVTADLHYDPVGPAVLSFRDPDNIQLEFFEDGSA
jgi:glyoxylase I family protein